MKYKLAYIIIFLVFLVIFQEILFRLIFPVPEIENFNRINYSPVFFNSNNSNPRFISNTSFIWASDPDGKESVIKLNIYGFRNKNWEAKPNPDKTRFIFIGDSFVEGYLAGDDETIPSAFEKISITYNREYECINLGIGGTDLLLYCKLLKDAVPALQPDNIFIILCANDLPPQKYTTEWFANPIQPVFTNKWVPKAYYVFKNLFAGNTIPRAWLSSPFTFFAPVPSQSNPWSIPEKADKFKIYVNSTIADAMEKGRFNPFSVDEYSQFKEHLIQPVKITEHLNGLQNYVSQYGKKIYLAYLPSKSQVSDYYLKYQKQFDSSDTLNSLMGTEYQVHAQALIRDCGNLGIPFFDLTPIILNEEKNGNHLYWNYDEHMKPEGYKLIGKNLYEWWDKLNSQGN